MRLIKATVDFETDSEVFWEAFAQTFSFSPFTHNFLFTDKQWRTVKSLPGWSSGEGVGRKV